jgi:predicted kinase
MPTVYLIEGPVGAGKSTYAEQFSVQLRAPHLNLDEWMVTLFSPDRPNTEFMPWYAERKRRTIEQIWRVACSLLDTDTSVLLELGLVQQRDREDFYRRVDGTDYDLKVHVLEVPKEVRYQRVQKRNVDQTRAHRMQVSDEIFEIANNAWQAPDAIECRERGIEIVSSFG